MAFRIHRSLDRVRYNYQAYLFVVGAGGTGGRGSRGERTSGVMEFRAGETNEKRNRFKHKDYSSSYKKKWVVGSRAV